MSLFSKKNNSENEFMSLLKSANNKSQANLETNNQSFEESFQDSVKILADFENTNNKEKLKEAGRLFLKLIQQNPSKVAPYVYSAYILYLFDLKEEAKKFIKLAETIDPNYQHIQKIKECIYT